MGGAPFRARRSPSGRLACGPLRSPGRFQLVEPKPAVGRAEADPPGARAASNSIVDWLRLQGRPKAFLDHLTRVDLSLAETLRDAYRLEDARRRLSLTLFIEFAREQRLSAGEVALLIGDAQKASSDALSYLIGAALREATSDDPGTRRRGGES